MLHFLQPLAPAAKRRHWVQHHFRSFSSPNFILSYLSSPLTHA
jgi:hypothetical protein